MPAQERDIVRPTGLRQVEDAHKDLSIRIVVGPKRGTSAVGGDDPGTEQSDAWVARLNTCPCPAPHAKSPVAACHHRAVGDLQARAGGPGCRYANAVTVPCIARDKALRILLNDLACQNRIQRDVLRLVPADGRIVGLEWNRLPSAL